ncbi:MAG: START-like domain-containing protein, partial [Bacteroidia bacterium]
KKKVAAKKTVKKAVKKLAPKKNTKAKASKPVKKAVNAKAKTVKKVTKKAAPKKKALVKKVVKKATPKPAKKVAKKIAPKKAAPKKVEKPAKPVKEKVVKSTAPKVEKVEKTLKSKKESKIEKNDGSEEESNGKDVVAVFNTIPKEQIETLSASKIASIASSITNPLRSDAVYSVQTDKEPSGKFEMEFPMRASAELLYEFFSTPSGLSEWFCDDVNIRNGIYTFIWDGQMQQARLLKTIDNQLARYQWVDKVDGSYFEFKIQKDDLTNDISLIIADFAESSSDRESSKLLWQSQIEKLMHVLGSMY